MDRTWRRAEAGVVIIALALLLFTAYPSTLGETANSRLATVYALVHHGTWYIERPIDEPPIVFEQRTVDKIRAGEHLLSSKPPVLTLLMAAEYFVLYHGFGFTLDNANDLPIIVYAMTLLCVVFPFGAMLVCFSALLRLLAVRPADRLAYLTALAFCTPIAGYAAVFNNHVLAASIITVSIYLLMRAIRDATGDNRFLLFMTGLFAGLVPTLDMPAGIFVVSGVAYLMWARPVQGMAWAVAGLALPILTHFAIMIHVTGSPVPVQMRNALWLYEASYWRNPGGMDALNEPKMRYLFHLTLGRKGLFSLYPVTLFGLVGAVRMLRAEGMRRRIAAGLGLAAALAFLSFYVLRTNNYGGDSYGCRWLIAALPALMTAGAISAPVTRRRNVLILFIFAAGVSLLSVVEGSGDPWRANREWILYFLGPSF
ncbi:MAG: hypothetical protein IIB38_05170 [Candidatus Hydrogenedentes bacterium]|nr:hypothetical protein [Candidatus Hydrogenedentota bacterium]